MKQNSIEFLFEKLWDTPKDKFEWNAILKQAKAMHKEEQISFAKKCLDKALDLDVRTAHLKVEEMYNETFGGNNETH